MNKYAKISYEEETITAAAEAATTTSSSHFSINNNQTTATIATSTRRRDTIEEILAELDFDNYELHTPEITNTDQTSSMWKPSEGETSAIETGAEAEDGGEASAALVDWNGTSKDGLGLGLGIGLAGAGGVGVGSLEELVDLLDLPGYGEEGRSDNFRFTNHCTTFGTEDMWPI